MNRREWFFAAVGLVLLSLSTFFLLRERIPAREVVLAQACGTPIRIMTPPANKDAPAAIVLHGLGANAVVMRSLGQFLANMGFRVYLLDLPGHGNNRERFSLMRAGECTVQTISLLERLGEIRLDHTVLIGHSMGGALAIRMADYFPAAATVAISPAPMIHTSSMPAGAVLMGPPHRMPVNLLIMMGQFDFPYSRESAEKLVQMGGGQRDAPEDFLEKRALKLVTVPRATHTSLIFDLPNDSPLATWLHKSLPENVRPQVVNAIKPELWGILGLLGLAFLFPLAASSTVFALGLKHVPPTVAGKSAKSAALFWLVAGLFAVSALKLFPQLIFLRMQYGGYLVSCLLLAGILLLVLLWATSAKQDASQENWQSAFAGAFLGAATMLVFGAWMTLQLTDTWLNDLRWLRFFPALLACLPYALAEEWALGAPDAGNCLAKLRRYLVFLILRLLIWLSILFALYVYASRQILLSVLVFYMGTFSLFTRFGADAIRRRTSSHAGAAVFTAILMAWFIAAVFPIT